MALPKSRKQPLSKRNEVGHKSAGPWARGLTCHRDKRHVAKNEAVLNGTGRRGLLSWWGPGQSATGGTRVTFAAAGATPGGWVTGSHGLGTHYLRPWAAGAPGVFCHLTPWPFGPLGHSGMRTPVRLWVNGATSLGDRLGLEGALSRLSPWSAVTIRWCPPACWPHGCGLEGAASHQADITTRDRKSTEKWHVKRN